MSLELENENQGTKVQLVVDDKENQDTQEFQPAELAVQEDVDWGPYTGPWILAKAGTNTLGKISIGVEVADIGKDGVISWSPLFGVNTKPALKCKQGGTIAVTIAKEEHSAILVHRPQGEYENAFLQRLRWNDGEVWARKGPQLSAYNGQWSRFQDSNSTPMGKIENGMLTWDDRFSQGGKLCTRPWQLERQPSGELQIDVEKKVLWVFVEDDPKYPGSQRLRWSDGDIWYRTFDRNFQMS